MNRSDFFRRLGLAVAALFAPVIAGREYIYPERFGAVADEDFTCRFVNCRFEGNEKFTGE